MAGEERIWLVLVVKDRYGNDSERESLRRHLMSLLGLGADEVYYVPVEKNRAFCNFIFAREHDRDNDLRRILESRRDCFEPYPTHMRICDSEFHGMVDGLDEAVRGIVVKYGDIVGIRNGVYGKLNGIALRESRSGKIEVGLKFCFGTVVEQYSPEDLVVKGNIFEHLKVLK